MLLCMHAVGTLGEGWTPGCHAQLNPGPDIHADVQPAQWSRSGMSSAGVDLSAEWAARTLARHT